MPRYDFTSLSSHDFEVLVRDALQAEWKIPLQSFTPGRDQGIDLQVGDGPGHTIIQCKHFAASGFPKLLAHVRDREVPKVAKLAPRRYVLVTSVALTPGNKDALLQALAPSVRDSADILGRDDVNNLLGRHPEVETAHFKLWLTSTPVLERVLHGAEVSRTEFEVRRVYSKLRLYVPNAAYPRALELLDQGNVVILSGIPGIGKTTLAELLLYAHLEKGYQPVLMRSDVREGRKVFKRSVKQIFYYDDFLGETFLGDGHGLLTHNRDADLLDFMAMVRESDSKLVMTTREHILSNAMQASERFRQSFILDAKCVLELSDYSFSDRAKILYNHIYFSDLPRGYREQLIGDDFFLKILKHRNFNPRLVEWLAAYTRVKSTSSENYRSFVLDLLENPQEIWRHSFEKQISTAAQSLLIALWSFGGHAHYTMLEPAWAELHATRCRRYGYPSAPNAFRTALKEIEGSFVKARPHSVDLLNPSVKDFLNLIVGQSVDQAADLVNSLCFATQLNTLWTLLGEPSGEAIFPFFRATADVIVSKAEKLFSNRGGFEILLERGQRSYLQDVLPERRASLAVEMASSFDSESAWKLCQKAVESLLDIWADGVTPDFEEAADLLDSLEELRLAKVAPAHRLIGGELFTRVRFQLATVLWLGNLRDFRQILKLPVHHNHASWTPSELAALRRSFKEYTEEGLGEEQANCSDADEVDELISMLSEIGRDLRCDVSEIVQSMVESAEEMRMSGGRRSRIQGQRIQRPEDHVDEESLDSAKSMFRKLLD